MPAFKNVLIMFWSVSHFDTDQNRHRKLRNYFCSIEDKRENHSEKVLKNASDLVQVPTNGVESPELSFFCT
jgi:hypothetical protein